MHNPDEEATARKGWTLRMGEQEGGSRNFTQSLRAQGRSWRNIADERGIGKRNGTTSRRWPAQRHIEFETVAFLARIASFRTSYLVIERFVGGRLSCRFFNMTHCAKNNRVQL
jgi:hypothetical protein